MAGKKPVPKQRSVRDIVEAICARMLQGERISTACLAEGASWKQLWFWKAADAELQALYARAREGSAEAWEDAATQDAEEATVENVQVARLKVDTKKWRAKMANPAKFSEKLDVTSDGARIGLETLVSGSMERKPA